MEGCDWSDWLLIYKSQDMKPGRDQLVVCSKEQWSWRNMNTYNSKQRCEFVWTKEDACEGCIFSVAQNMMKLGRQQGYGLPCKMWWGTHRIVCSQATAIWDCSTYLTHYCMVNNHLWSISQPSTEPSRSCWCFPLYKGSRPRMHIQPVVLLKNYKPVFSFLYFLTFLFTKPRVLLAVLVILLMCEFQLISALMFAPRYLAESSDSSSWPCM